MSTYTSKIQIDRSTAIPLYHQIQSYFSNLIVKNVLLPGDQLPGVPLLTRELNVNYRTVLQAYSELADKGLVDVVKGKGTFVRDRSGQSRIKTISIINSTPLTTEDGHNYHALSVYEGIRQALNLLEWKSEFRVIQPGVDPIQWANKSDGCIILATNPICQTVIDAFAGSKITAVAVSGDGLKIPAVGSDERQGVNLLIDHLVGLGHRDIALIANSARVSSERRVDAYCKAMEEYEIDISPLWLYVSQSPYLDDMDEQDELFERLFKSRRKPSAIIAASGYLGMSTLQMLHRHKVNVPEDVSVCSFDDYRPMAFLSPPMTTIRQNSVKIGKTAVDMLAALLAGKERKSSLVPVELVVRSSTAAVAR